MSKLDEPFSNNETVSTTIYASLNNLVLNGIELDKNLRQPTYYSTVNNNEFKYETFGIISDLLTNQKVPIWLSQRIAWFYTNKFLNEIINDLAISTNSSDAKLEHIDYVDEPKTFSREKMVVYLRNSISKIIKEWQMKKSRQNKPNLLFSFARYQHDLSSNLKYSEFGIKNKRRTMEDKVAIIENIDLIRRNFSDNSGNELFDKSEKKPNALFGVFDGHCGVDCAQYLSKHLPMVIIKHPDFNKEKNYNKVFNESFQTVNQNFLQKAQKESLRSGSTCCLGILSTEGNQREKFSSLDVAWCGDTRLGLVQNGRLTFLTDEHKPDNALEKKRILNAGGNVAFISNAWRIDGSLAVSRSFGDIDYQPSVISEPEIKHFDFDGDEDYMIIGCDGLWESLDLNELCSYIYDKTRSTLNADLNIAELLVRKAQSNGSSDNITAIFVLLKKNFNQITKPS